MTIFSRLLPYKELLYIFVWRDFCVRYRDTVFGVLWAIIQPLSFMLLITFIFTYILRVKVGDFPRPLFFYSALLPWGFFNTSINYSVTSLRGNRTLITKIYFPREILPISGMFVAFIDLLIASLLYFIMLFAFGLSLNWNMLWLIPIMTLLIIFTISVSLIFATLNVYYRDVGMLTRFLIQILFFGSPIIYSIDTLSTKLKILLFFNPLTFIIENTRRCILEGRGVVLWQFIFAIILVLILFYYSHKMFLKVEKDIPDVI